MPVDDRAPGVAGLDARGQLEPGAVLRRVRGLPAPMDDDAPPDAPGQHAGDAVAKDDDRNPPGVAAEPHASGAEAGHREQREVQSPVDPNDPRRPAADLDGAPSGEDVRDGE